MTAGLVVSFWAEDSWHVGLAGPDSVVPLRLASEHGYSGMRTLLASSDSVRRAVLEDAAERLSSGKETMSRREIRLGPTVPDPDKILCVGFNYAAHTKEMSFKRPVAPDIFSKFRNGLTCDQADVELPVRSVQIDYEGELGVVVGRRCRAVSADSALDYVAGYTIINDVTARDLQFRTTQWTLGKALDGFCPMGPGLALKEYVGDVGCLEIVTTLNGQVVQHGCTADMVFPVPELIAEISSSVTLEPGDVISTGTPAGVGYKADPPRFLSAGDEVTITIDPIGSLTNRFVASTMSRLPVAS
jgi:acylpyruvate hydrolase